jgi:hypothetical protein
MLGYMPHPRRVPHASHKPRAKKPVAGFARGTWARRTPDTQANVREQRLDMDNQHDCDDLLSSEQAHSEDMAKRPNDGVTLLSVKYRAGAVCDPKMTADVVSYIMRYSGCRPEVISLIFVET